MKNTRKLLDATGLSYPEYDAWRFDNFIAWTYTIAELYFMSAKNLIKHDGMLNWYYDMWLLHVEKQFLLDNADLLEMSSPSEMQTILMTYPDEIKDMHPTALIKMIKKTNKSVKIKA